MYPNQISKKVDKEKLYMSKEKKKNSRVLSRRDFLKDAGLIAGGAAIGSTVLLAACAAEPETTTITETSTAPGTTVTSTATSTAPGSTVTQTVTSTAPGSTVTSTAPGTTSTVTQTVPGPTQTVTATKTVVPTATGEQLITVMNPEGPRPPIELKQLAPRLDTVEGKTIYVVSVNFTATDNWLHSLRELFEERIANCTAIFKVKRGNYGAADLELWDEIEANGDAMVMAVGH
jgi:hypothetical protein